MKNAAAIFLIFLSVLATAQQPSGAPPGQRIVTTTRLVALFSDLETRLLRAIQKNDPAEFDALLSKEFEVWSPEPPGSPTPRAEWLQRVTRDDAKPRSFSVLQTAVRGLDDHAVASFVLVQQAGPAGKEQREQFFVVDLWSRTGANWMLTERYLSRIVDIQSSAHPKPTGKQ